MVEEYRKEKDSDRASRSVFGGDRMALLQPNKCNSTFALFLLVHGLVAGKRDQFPLMEIRSTNPSNNLPAIIQRFHHIVR